MVPRLAFFLVAHIALPVLAASPAHTKTQVTTTSPAIVDAIHIRVQTDGGPDPEKDRSWECWAARKLGHRTEMGRVIYLYNERSNRSYTLGRTNSLARERPADTDSLMTQYWLNHGDAAKNQLVTYLLACRETAAFKEITIQRDGRAIRQISALDYAGHPMSAEIDVSTNRVLRTDAWTWAKPESPSVHAVSQFAYPTPAQIDPKLFEPPKPPGSRTTTSPAKNSRQADG